MPLTQAQVIRSSSLVFSAGLELLDSTDTLIKDISDDFLGGSVSHNNTSRIHGSAKLRIAAPYNWNNQRLRPYVTLTDSVSGDSYRWDLGIYLPETPRRSIGLTPAIFDIEAYGKLIILDTPYGSTYRVAAGAGYIATIETILSSLGLSSTLDQTAAASTLPAERIWPLDEKVTYLSIINDLLAAIGYNPLYADRSGAYRSEPYVAPSGRSPIFTYSTSADDSVVVLGGLEEESDLFDIPNVWVFVNNDPTLTLPTEGNGIYTVTNQSSGITSIDGRGRTKRRIVRLDAADQAALVSQGDRIVQEDKQPSSHVKLRSSPNPTHWHDDLVTVTAPEISLSGTKFVELGWTLPLDGSPMEHILRKVV